MITPPAMVDIEAEYAALSHCPVCDLWLTAHETCLHIGTRGSGHFLNDAGDRLADRDGSAPVSLSLHSTASS